MDEKSPKRVGKTPRRPRDPNQRAKLIVDIATGESDEAKSPAMPDRAAAAERARKVASKGGRGRAEKLSAEERAELARRAAVARWSRDS
jgi:hypothetical protein